MNYWRTELREQEQHIYTRIWHTLVSLSLLLWPCDQCTVSKHIHEHYRPLFMVMTRQLIIYAWLCLIKSGHNILVSHGCVQASYMVDSVLGGFWRPYLCITNWHQKWPDRKGDRISQPLVLNVANHPTIVWSTSSSLHHTHPNHKWACVKAYCLEHMMVDGPHVHM